MTDPELQALMAVSAVGVMAALHTDRHLCCLILCRLVNISLQHGTSGGGAYAFAGFGYLLGPTFHRYRDGYNFARLACNLAEKQGVAAYRAKVEHVMGLVAVWTQPISIFIDLHRTVFRTANEAGESSFACFSVYHITTGLFVRNDPLDAVWRETQLALDFVRKAKFQDFVDIVVSQQRFVATMQGRTATFSTFSDAQFDEAAFEAQLTEDRFAYMVCIYFDSQTEGAVHLRRLCRGTRRSRQGEAAAVVRTRPNSDARLLLLHRADDGGVL